MAKKEAEHKGGEGEKKKPERKHLHEIRTQAAHDGTYVHHHTYKAKESDHHTEPERQNVATSNSPEEAGQHVAEQMAMNQQGGEGEMDPGAAEEPQGGGGAPMPGQ
jgi:hypothetical protein